MHFRFAARVAAACRSANWRALARPLMETLLPAACALCGARADALLCAPCRQQFFGLPRHRCAVCANPLADAGAARCGRCLARPPAFDATVAAADYAAPLDQLVLQLKFGGRLALAPLCAHLLRDAVLEQPGFALPTVLCAVPLGPGRLAERGFNQALEIARPLARALGIACYPALAARLHDTAAQSGVALAQRQRNIAHAFALAPGSGALVRGRHVGLVDDVMTSGQTLGELAATFKRHGAARVSNLVLLRTPPR